MTHLNEGMMDFRLLLKDYTVVMIWEMSWGVENGESVKGSP